METITFKKSDFWASLAIGGVAATMLFFIIKNLGIENEAIALVLPYVKYLFIIFPIFCVSWLFFTYLLSKKRAIFFQIGKFALSGGFSFLVDMSILNVLVFSTGIAIGMTQSVFKILSSFVAMVGSFLLNKKWVFEAKTDKNGTSKFLQFILISIVGLLLNAGIDYLLVNTVGSVGNIPLKTWTQVSAMIAAAITMFWNFIGYKFIVFKK